DKGRALPPLHFMRLITSWGLGFDGEEQSQSRVAGGLAGAFRIAGQPRYFFLRAFAEHLNYPDTKKRMRELLGGVDPDTKKRMPGVWPWKLARRHYVEKKANGSALLSELKGEITGLEAVTPKDSKGDRLLVH